MGAVRRGRAEFGYMGEEEHTLPRGRLRAFIKAAQAVSVGQEAVIYTDSLVTANMAWSVQQQDQDTGQTEWIKMQGASSDMRL